MKFLTALVVALSLFAGACKHSGSSPVPGTVWGDSGE